MLRTSILIVLLLGTAHAKAFESLYVVNNQIGKSQAELGFSHQRSQFGYVLDNKEKRGTGAANVWDIGFHHSFDEVTSLGVGTSFSNSTMTNSQSGQSFAASGLGNIDINFKSGIVYKPTTMTFGANASISPGPAEDASTVFNKDGNVSNSLGNNFTGYNSLSPFIGSESYIGETAVGISGSVDFYSRQTKSNGSGETIITQGAKTGLGINGFVEIPLFKNVDAGISTGVKRTDMEMGRIFARQEGSLFNSAIYSNLRYDKNTMISVRLSADEDNKLDHESSSSLGVLLKRSL